MKNKIKVMVSGIHYPLSMMSYFIRAFERREDVELYTSGPFTGSWIPWNHGMNVPEKYVKPPTFALPREAIHQRLPSAIIESQMDTSVDLWLQVDAGWHFTNRPKKAGIVAHVQTDPHCVSGDTLLCTDKGFLFANEASVSSIRGVSSRDRFSSCGGAMLSGWKQTRRLIVENGYELVCTDDHLVETSSGMVRADELSIGDDVILSRRKTAYGRPSGQAYDYSVGFVIGAFQGDGSFGSSDMVKFTVGTESKKELIDALKTHLSVGFDLNVVTTGKHYSCENATVLQVRRWGFHRFLKSLDLKSGHVPHFVRTGSTKMFAGYLAGLLATDGCSVDGRIQFTTKWSSLAKELQVILLHYGVVCRRTEIISSKSSYKPGQHYTVLYINAGESSRALEELTGHIPGRVIGGFGKSIKETSGDIQTFKVISIDGAVKNNPSSRISEPVYDVYNSETSTFLAGGFSVHNCLKSTYLFPKAYSDINFCMQTPYIENDERYLSYAYDPTVHYPMDVDKQYDACLIGLLYGHRDSLIKRLSSKGLVVYYNIGEIFDEYRERYNQSKVALSWSSLLDLPTRVFEALAMGIPLVANRVPDMNNFFVDGEHYLGFDTLEEAEAQVLRLMIDDDLREEIGQAGYRKVTGQGHSWDSRIETILDACKLL